MRGHKIWKKYATCFDVYFFNFFVAFSENLNFMWRKEVVKTESNKNDTSEMDVRPLCSMFSVRSNRNFLFIHNVRFHFFCIISTTLVFFFKIDCTGHLKKMLSWKRRNKQDTKINLSDFHGKGTNLDIHFEIYIIKAGVCVFVNTRMSKC